MHLSPISNENLSQSTWPFAESFSPAKQGRSYFREKTRFERVMHMDMSVLLLEHVWCVWVKQSRWCWWLTWRIQMARLCCRPLKQRRFHTQMREESRAVHTYVHLFRVTWLWWPRMSMHARTKKVILSTKVSRAWLANRHFEEFNVYGLDCNYICHRLTVWQKAEIQRLLLASPSLSLSLSVFE